MILSIKNMEIAKLKVSQISTRGVIFSVLLTFLTLIISIVSGYFVESFSAASFFYFFKYLLVVFAVFPFHYFSARESNSLFVGLLFNFVFILSYDKLHETFGAGLYNYSALTGTFYQYLDSVALPFYFLLLGTLLIAKYSILSRKSVEEDLVSDLRARIRELEKEREELKANSIKLRGSESELSAQKEEIQSVNDDLRNKLITKNNLLKHMNEELMKHAGELRQFSFTVSHHLRAPVAALKGLFNLIKEPGSESNDVIGKMGEVLINLDNLMSDMNKITHIRNEVYRTNEKVDFMVELENVKQLLSSDIESNDVQIETDFSPGRFVYSVRSIVNSIMYNLVSNGIKFHSPNEGARIKLWSEVSDDYTILKVRDYGVGMDIAKNRKNLFRLYSRFNPEVEGKGMGLYLCKMQIESLGGEIEVDSVVGKWTEFTVKFRNSANLARKVLFENRSALIYQDKDTGLNTVKWKNDIDFGCYKEVYLHMVALQAQYSPGSWILDYTDQGHVPVEFHMWLHKNILPAIEKTLKRILYVKKANQDTQMEGEVKETVKSLEKLGIEVSAFDSIESLILELTNRN